MTVMLDAALELASLGWPVFPCVETPGEKAKSPYTRNGFHDASTDPEIIRRWWEYKPNALIGLAIPAHMLVIDIDPHNGGSREALETKVGPLPKTLTAWSGRGDGGCHLYFYRPNDTQTLTKTKLPPGIDLREGSRHYVIAPPSLHPDTGRMYRLEWENWDTGPIACVPYDLYELLKLDLPHKGRFLYTSDGHDNFSNLLDWVAGAQEGRRNDYTFFAACRLAEKNALDTHEDQLLDAATSTGLSESEIRSSIQSARRRIG